jgi:hypothetical protein
MKHLILVLLLAFTAPVFTACQSGAFTVAPGADPLVVHSERAIESAFVVVDEFLKWEYANQKTAGKEVHRVAEQIRRDYKEADTAARNAVKAYKSNRNSANQANLTTWIALLLDLKTSAVAHYGGSH